MLSFSPQYKTHRDFDDAQSGSVFIFASNLSGRHCSGAALTAANRYAASFGIGAGRTGQAYAIPTKGHRFEVLDVSIIDMHVANFKAYAAAHPKEHFFITRIGCGMGGYKDGQIAPLFQGITDNVSIPVQWAHYLKRPTLRTWIVSPKGELAAA